MPLFRLRSFNGSFILRIKPEILTSLQDQRDLAAAYLSSLVSGFYFPLFPALKPPHPFCSPLNLPNYFLPRVFIQHCFFLPDTSFFELYLVDFYLV